MGMETKTERLIKAAISRLSKAKKGAASAEFAQVFYGQSVPDELAEYSGPDLAAIAASAMRFAAKRSPGRHKIRVFNPEVKADGWSDGATVVQILNDDMPFLVDSVLSLLSDLNAGVRLVLHPIISLSRSNGGAMAGLAGDDQTHAANVGRESLIHVHIDPIFEKAERSALEEQISSVLDDVRTTVLDWQPMVGRVRNAVLVLSDQSAVGGGRRARGIYSVSAMAARQSLYVSRHQGIRVRRPGRQGPAQGGAEIRSGHSARSLGSGAPARP